jgi:hypothetical protein
MIDKDNTKVLLEAAVTKRDELNTFIKVLSEMLGVPGESGASPALRPSMDTPPVDTGDPGFDPMSVVYPGMFFGKSQTKAARMLLEKVKPRLVKTRTIYEALKKGGLNVGGKKPLVNLWGVLQRNKKVFILVPKAGWGLVEWYTPAEIAKMRSQPVQEAEEEKSEVA